MLVAIRLRLPLDHIPGFFRGIQAWRSGWSCQALDLVVLLSEWHRANKHSSDLGNIVRTEGRKCHLVYGLSHALIKTDQPDSCSSLMSFAHVMVRLRPTTHSLSRSSTKAGVGQIRLMTQDTYKDIL